MNNATRWMRRNYDGAVFQYDDLSFRGGGFTEISYQQVLGARGRPASLPQALPQIELPPLEGDPRDYAPAARSVGPLNRLGSSPAIPPAPAYVDFELPPEAQEQAETPAILDAATLAGMQKHELFAVATGMGIQNLRDTTTKAQLVNAIQMVQSGQM